MYFGNFADRFRKALSKLKPGIGALLFAIVIPVNFLFRAAKKRASLVGEEALIT